MNWRNTAFDWNQARAFLATAEEGSLSAAARALGQTQPTLSRQVAALEEDLGVILFERIGRRLEITEAGLALLDHIRAMGEAAIRASLAASGKAEAIAGRVVITATEMTASYYLPSVLKRIRQAAPGLEIEILTSNEVRDLMHREADIAIRHGQPDQPELIARKLGGTVAHIYGTAESVDALGPVRRPEDLRDATFIGFETAERLLPVLHDLGLPLTRRSFPLAASSGAVILEMVRAGLGLAIIPRDMAERWPDLRPVLTETVALPVPIWLATHRELHTSRRIRLVFDHIAEGIAALQRGDERHGCAGR